MKTSYITPSPRAALSLRLFAGLIEEGRLRKGWTRDELAERVGVGVITMRQVAAAADHQGGDHQPAGAGRPQ